MPADQSTPRIRLARREDIPELVRCATTSTEEQEGVGFGTAWSQRTFTDAGRLHSAFQEPGRVGNQSIFVAEVGGRVVGFVTVEERDKEFELVDVEVARDHQGRGVGSRLVRSVEERGRETRKLAVTLGTSRNAAGVAWKSLEWWIARDYRVTGEVENEWTRSIGPGVREIRMRKELR